MEFLCLFRGTSTEMLAVFRCLGRVEASKSAIQMENSCFCQSQVFSKGRGLKISYFRSKTSICIKLRCLGSAEGSKAAILDGKQLLYQNQVFRKGRWFKISYLDGKQSFTSCPTHELLTLTTKIGTKCKFFPS